MNITVKYSCYLCGILARPVSVPARGHEDIVTWMAKTIIVLADDHIRQSPRCPAEKLSDVRVPVSEGNVGKVGAPPTS